MRCVVVLGLFLAVVGCVAGPAPFPQPGPWDGGRYDNPTLIVATDPFHVWETVVEVVGDYFAIAHEEPARRVDSVVTEGRLETLPELGATIFEPWRYDSVGLEERLESTLQTIRRRAVVRVMPGERGFWVEVAVFKELEDARRPSRATAGAATFRTDTSLVRIDSPVGEQPPTAGWIPLGRDEALEQRILGHLLTRFGQPTRTVPTPLLPSTPQPAPPAWTPPAAPVGECLGENPSGAAASLVRAQSPPKAPIAPRPDYGSGVAYAW